VPQIQASRYKLCQVTSARVCPSTKPKLHSRLTLSGCRQDLRVLRIPVEIPVGCWGNAVGTAAGVALPDAAALAPHGANPALTNPHLL